MSRRLAECRWQEQGEAEKRNISCADRTTRKFWKPLVSITPMEKTVFILNTVFKLIISERTKTARLLDVRQVRTPI